ncbi:MAG: NAD(P)H-hydrate dehydratase [Chloroflexota bacterium]|nr:NAD(P)H-hydrate dehydratase [Chloroflexota bacterium]
MKVATAAQMRRLEELAVDRGANWAGLMANAGHGMAQIAMEMLHDVRRGRVLVLVGPGNNGGDGLVIARHLHDAGAHVAIYIWKRRAAQDDWPRNDTRARGIREVDAGEDTERVELAKLLEETALVVDALLGTGLTRPVEEELCSIIDAVNRANRPVLAADIPTGVQSDTGAILGCAIRATATAAAGVLKPGLLFMPGAEYAGATRVVAIGLPETLENEKMAETMTGAELRALLPARPADAHKGTFGKVLVIAGSGRYPGAAYLSARGALRSGAGLVTLATARSVYGPLVAASHETTFLPLPEEDWGVLGSDAAAELLGELGNYNAIVLGPGLGREDATKTFLQRLLKLEPAKAASGVGFVRAAPHADRERKPAGSVGFLRAASAKETARASDEQAPATELPTLVLDADALNLLAQIDGWNERLAPGKAILTPHPAEMARLLGLDGPAEVNADRLETTRRAAGRWQQIVVLKGASTVVADPDGRAAIGPGGNPALATAGTGDVLAGLIGGFIAQGVELFDAARLGVYLHAAAGRLVREEVGEAGAVAGDLLDRIPRAITALRDKRMKDEG